jgi:pimeloyl-ACP methyl ester carboxylesterase
MANKETSMDTKTTLSESGGNFIRANGIDIHYVDVGAGQPLILLENGMISTNPIWRSWLSSYAGHRGTFAQHFRVIAPDFRGSGRTVHSGGPIPYSLLADDVVALIDALELQQPFICGYSDGGHVATIVSLRKPEAVRAIVNHAGYDLFNPDPRSPSLIMTRQMLGGRADATRAAPDAVAQSQFLRPMVELMKADHDAAQGPDHWKAVLAQTFDRVSRPSGYTVEDLRAITVPTLILVGDRDQFCTVEEGVTAYRALRDGELAVLPNAAHGGIDSTAVNTTIEFFRRRISEPRIGPVVGEREAVGSAFHHSLEQARETLRRESSVE